MSLQFQHAGASKFVAILKMRGHLAAVWAQANQMLEGETNIFPPTATKSVPCMSSTAGFSDRKSVDLIVLKHSSATPPRDAAYCSGVGSPSQSSASQKCNRSTLSALCPLIPAAKPLQGQSSRTGRKCQCESICSRACIDPQLKKFLSKSPLTDVTTPSAVLSKKKAFQVQIQGCGSLTPAAVAAVSSFTIHLPADVTP